MDNKEQITTRTYKIKAIVIGILAVMVYIASQYVMFCNLPIIESTGERVETDFLKWAINRNIALAAICSSFWICAGCMVTRRRSRHSI